MKIHNIFRLIMLSGGLLLAAACSDDKTEYSNEVAFQGSDGNYVCLAAGGEQTISFFSQCGHWELELPEGAGDWLEVWPLYGDDNGKTTITVAELKSAYDRTASIGIVTARGVVGQIVITQKGADPYIRFDLQSDRIRTDYLGTPVTVNVTGNLDWKAEILPAEGGAQPDLDWISLGETTETSQEFLFADNTDLPKRECIVRFRMVGGDYYVDLPAVQRAGNTAYELSEVISIADLLDEVQLDSNGAYEIEDNYAVEARIVSSFAGKNMPDSVIYLQDESRRGLKLLLKDKADFLTPPAEREGWYVSGRKLAVHICGLEFRRDPEGNLAISDVPASVVMKSEDGGGPILVPGCADFSKLDDLLNTSVVFHDTEWVFPYGCYTNYWEVAAQSIDKVEELWANASEVQPRYKASYADFHLYPQLLRDKKGQVVKAWFTSDFTEALSKNLPQGSGQIAGIVSMFRGEPVIQLRTTGDDRIAETGNRISRTLLRGGPWQNNAKTTAEFAVGNSGDDRSSVIYSLKNNGTDEVKTSSGSSGGMYWLDAAFRYDSGTAWNKDDERRYLSLNASYWWSGTDSRLSNTKDLGEAYILRTNTLRNATGDVWIAFSTSSSKGGPGWMKLQWAETDSDDLSNVEFHDIATYNSPVIDYHPYLMPYSFKLPAEMKGKSNVVILFRCADGNDNARRLTKKAQITNGGTNRLGSIEIVEIK